MTEAKDSKDQSTVIQGKGPERVLVNDSEKNDD